MFKIPPAKPKSANFEKLSNDMQALTIGPVSPSLSKRTTPTRLKQPPGRQIGSGSHTSPLSSKSASRVSTPKSASRKAAKRPEWDDRFGVNTPDYTKTKENQVQQKTGRSPLTPHPRFIDTHVEINQLRGPSVSKSSTPAMSFQKRLENIKNDENKTPKVTPRKSSASKDVESELLVAKARLQARTIECEEYKKKFEIQAAKIDHLEADLDFKNDRILLLEREIRDLKAGFDEKIKEYEARETALHLELQESRQI